MTSSSGIRREEKGRGRHPLLLPGRSTASAWRLIKRNPGITTNSLKAQGINHQRISDLLVAGLIRPCGKEGRFRKFEIVDGAETGFGRDKVEVELKVFQASDGQFSAEAKILGQFSLGGIGREVFKRNMTFMIPRDDESLQTFAGKTTLIIDADYVSIEESPKKT